MTDAAEPEVEGPFAPEFGALAATAPGAYAALVGAWLGAHDEVDPDILRLARHRVDDQLGLVSGRGTEPDTELERALAALTDQFVFYVPQVGPELLDPVRRHLGRDGLNTFVDALYVLDQTARVRISHGRLFPAERPPPRAPEKADRPPSLRPAIRELHAEAMLLQGLDPLTTEVVRLRAANYHDCKT